MSPETGVALIRDWILRNPPDRGNGWEPYPAAEIKQTNFRLDGLLEPPADRPDVPLLFTEAQFQRRPRFFGWISYLSEDAP